MIPYPSGSLHIGHIKNYTISDIFNRFIKLQKYNIYNYIAWDCFGTPAENASIIKSVPPSYWIKNNIIYMRKQLKLMNFLYKWKNEYTTSYKNYYKITQWIFYKLIKFKFIYIKNSFVNWDPVDKSVLSNEQVINGRGWRSNALVEKIKKKTYFVNLIYYKKELYNEIKNLNWPSNVKLMQSNWLGNLKKINLYIFLKKKKIIYKFSLFLEDILNLFKIKFLISFLNDYFLKKRIIYIKKKFIFFNIGFNFNVKYFNIKIESWFFKKRKKKYTLYYVNINFYFFDFNKIDFSYFIKNKFNIIKIKNTWNIKNWGISRQRYWGTPIPLIFCKNCGFLFNFYKKLPIILPKFLKSTVGLNLLKINNFYLNTICFLCKNKCIKEFETLDTFFDSCWYFLKYLNFKEKKNKINKWLPIDFYIGGIEHSVLHLLYSRFIIKFLRDIKYLNFGEPIKKLFSLGMVLNQTYYTINNNIKEWISKDNLNNNIYFKGRVEKMSKSKKNGVNPDDIVKNYGVDSLRLTVIYFSDLNKDFLWNDNFIKKSYKYINNIWNFYLKIKNYVMKKKIYYENNINYNEKKFLYFFYKNIEKLNFFYINFIYNKLVNNLFILLNIIKDIKIKNLFILNELFSILLRFLNPIIPIITNKIWNNLFYKKQINYIKKTFWPRVFFINIKNQYKFLLLINNKKKFIIKYNKKNIYLKFLFNYIFFKKKVFIKNIIKKIIFNKKIINIIF